MINRDMRYYNFFTFGAVDSYGQPQPTTEPQGVVKMAVSPISQSIVDNVRYKDASYLGLTQGYIDDKYLIQYGDEKLKVLYIIPKGRYKQVFLKNV